MSTNPAHEYDEPRRSYGSVSYAQSVRMHYEHRQLQKILKVKRKEEEHAEEERKRHADEKRREYEQQMRTFDEKRGKVTQVAEKPTSLPDTDQVKAVDTQQVRAIRISPPVVVAFKQEIERTIGIYRNERGHIPGYIAMSPRNRIWIRKQFPEQLKDCFRLQPAGVEIAYYVDDELDDLSFYCM